MGVSPIQSVGESLGDGSAAGAGGEFLDDFWAVSDAAAYGLTRAEFDAILLRAGAAQNFGLPEGTRPSRREQAGYFASLKLNDLVLARACAAGNERAWEHLVAAYHEPLVRAAIAITGSDTRGQDLAAALYAELYGLTERDGERRCPLDSYRGRGSLMGWLRTTLAQRHVDHYRRTHREQELDDAKAIVDLAAAAPELTAEAADRSVLEKAIKVALRESPAEDRFILAAYYLDGRKLLQIAQLLDVHEATVSR